jgi:long-chain fatty acid transport protein
LNRFILLSIVTCLPLFALGGGFQVNLQGQKNTGMGHCGTGLLLGSTSAFFNPGAYAFSKNEISLGASFVSAFINYQEPRPGMYSANNVPRIGTPFSFYTSYRFKEDSKFNLGLAVYTPFGSGIQYEDDWKGQFLMREMSLQTIFFQPTIGYQLSDKLGIGVGIVYGTGDFSLRRAVPVQDYQGNYGEASLTGQGQGFGYNVGVYYQAHENISIGLSYRSAVQVDLNNGQAVFQVPESIQENFPATGFTSSLRLPSVLNFGVGLNITEKTLLSLDLNYVGWSSYDTLSFDFEQNTETLQDVNSPRNYKNVVIARIGIQHQVNDIMMVRGGFYYDFTPVQDGYMTPETPDTDKIGLTLGGTFAFSDKLEVDISLLYVFGSERRDTNFETNFEGVWNSRAVIPGIGLTYKF